jgi:transcription factor SOX7/8/10/18 (SOX group E/F)
MFGAPFDTSQAQSWATPQAAALSQQDGDSLDGDDSDSSHRPPNAFILYSNAMRLSIRQDNPALSNTEVSRLLGKMWKEFPNEAKQVYKQEEFKH